ncbi:hypothetical protein ACJJI4_09330 [Microbulbifer sp. TRSA002]|uniref:hypothetical protein n=1 Tax=Microbulbifer sp. TRSA002 TaxID=3243382 RepID=UPI00403A236A
MNYKLGFRWTLITLNLAMVSWFGFSQAGTGYIDESGHLDVIHILIRSLAVILLSFIASVVIVRSRGRGIAISIITSLIFGVLLLWSGLVTNSMSEYGGSSGLLYGITTFLVGFTLTLFSCSVVYVGSTKVINR